MKKDKFLLLLQGLEQIGVAEEELLKVLNLDENILDLLASVNLMELNEYVNIIELYPLANYNLREIIMILRNAKHFCVTADVLLSKRLIEAGIVLEGARIVNESKEYFNAKYASQVLTNEDAIKSGIALDGAKTINESDNEFNSQYASQVLMDEGAIKSGIALEGARIINESKKYFNAKCASEFLLNERALELGNAVTLATKANELKHPFERQYLINYSGIYEQKKDYNFGDFISSVECANTDDIDVDEFVKRLIPRK